MLLELVAMFRLGGADWKGRAYGLHTLPKLGAGFTVLAATWYMLLAVLVAVILAVVDIIST
jgi:hypothetical protein